MKWVLVSRLSDDEIDEALDLLIRLGLVDYIERAVLVENFAVADFC